MESVGFELLAGHLGHDCGGKPHEAGGLVVGRIAPAVSLLARWLHIADADRIWAYKQRQSKAASNANHKHVNSRLSGLRPRL